MSHEMPIKVLPKNEDKKELPQGLSISDHLTVRVWGIPVHSHETDVKEFFLQDLKLKPLNVYTCKKWRGNEFRLDVTLEFEDLEQICNAVTIIEDAKWKNQDLKASIELPSSDQSEFLTEIQDVQFTPPDGARQVPLGMMTEFTAKKAMSEKTTPYYDIPYDKQLKIKQNTIRRVLQTTSKEMRKAGGTAICSWLDGHKKNKNLPCKLWGIRASNKVKGYRNKCEFTVGHNYSGEQVVIGFMLVKLEDTKKLSYFPVGPIDHLIHVPERMLVIARVLQEYFRHNTDIIAHEPGAVSPCWSMVTMRTNKTNDVMVMLTIKSQLPQSNELWSNAQASLKTWYEEVGQRNGITSLYLHVVFPKDKGDISEDKLYHLCGSVYLEEELCNLKFQISPSAFFQVNTRGAELLYRTALELARVDKDTTVLDVCCGTGTIGIFFSQYCGEVLGVESEKSAVSNAKENAKINNVNNCEFFHGKAEDLLGALSRRATKGKVVAIVNPPRAGLHNRTIWTLRAERKISRIIYISCEPRKAKKNWIDLARAPSKRYKGDPFVPIEAVPVDMFPHTNHCELVVCLERLTDALVSSRESELAEGTVGVDEKLFDQDIENVELEPPSKKIRSAGSPTSVQ